MIRRRVVVHGFVQGVGFRYSVLRRARQRSLAGWVTNRHDGSVEAVFEGDEDAVEILVAFMRAGPRGAEVEHVEVDDQEPGGIIGFKVH